jgi:hypothetical protein
MRPALGLLASAIPTRSFSVLIAVLLLLIHFLKTDLSSLLLFGLGYEQNGKEIDFNRLIMAKRHWGVKKEVTLHQLLSF